MGSLGLWWSGYLAFIKHLHGGMSHHTGFLILTAFWKAGMTHLILQMEKQRLRGVRDWLTCPKDPKLLKYGNKI